MTNIFQKIAQVLPGGNTQSQYKCDTCQRGNRSKNQPARCHFCGATDFTYFPSREERWGAKWPL